MILVLIFILVKGIVLAKRRNPLIVQSEIPQFFDGDDRFDLEDSNFKFAFGVQGYKDKMPRDSPDLVRWAPMLVTDVDGVRSKTPLNFHLCNETDWAQFNPVVKKSEKKL